MHGGVRLRRAIARWGHRASGGGAFRISIRAADVGGDFAGVEIGEFGVEIFGERGE